MCVERRAISTSRRASRRPRAAVARRRPHRPSARASRLVRLRENKSESIANDASSFAAGKHVDATDAIAAVCRASAPSSSSTALPREITGSALIRALDDLGLRADDIPNRMLQAVTVDGLARANKRFSRGSAVSTNRLTCLACMLCGGAFDAKRPRSEMRDEFRGFARRIVFNTRARMNRVSCIVSYVDTTCSKRA